MRCARSRSNPRATRSATSSLANSHPQGAVGGLDLALDQTIERVQMAVKRLEQQRVLEQGTIVGREGARVEPAVRADRAQARADLVQHARVQEVRLSTRAGARGAGALPGRLAADLGVEQLAALAERVLEGGVGHEREEAPFGLRAARASWRTAERRRRDLRRGLRRAEQRRDARLQIGGVDLRRRHRLADLEPQPRTEAARKLVQRWPVLAAEQAAPQAARAPSARPAPASRARCARCPA